MKPSLLLLVALLFSQSSHAADVPNCFVGRWKSDEALTLEDMRKHPEVTEKARLLFEKGFFGRLVLVFGQRYVGGYLDGEQRPEELTFQRVDVLERGSDWLILRSRLLGSSTIRSGNVKTVESMHWLPNGSSVSTSHRCPEVSLSSQAASPNRSVQPTR